MAATDSPVYYEFELDGVDIKSYVLNLEGEKEHKEAVTGCTIVVNRNFSSIFDIDTTLINKYITIKRGKDSSNTYFLFRGYVRTIRKTSTEYVLICKNKYFDAQRAEVTKTFDINEDSEAGVGSEIFKTLINTYTDLTADNTSVQSTGTVLTLKKYRCNHAEVFERADNIAYTYDYQHYYNDYDDLVYFEPRGFQTESKILRVGTNIKNNPEWTYDEKKLVNALTIVGFQQTVEESIFQDGTNAEGQKVVLTYVPSSVKVYVGSGSFDPSGTGTKPSDNQSNLRTGGKVDTTSGTFDYEYDPDEEIKSVFFYDSSKGPQPSYTPPSGTNNIEVQYSFELDTPIFGKRQSSIDTYGKIQDTIKKDDIRTVADAEVYLSSYLDRYSEPFLSASLLVENVEDIRVGRQYRVIDSRNNIDSFFIVTNLKFFYPYRPDEIVVGDRILRDEEFDVNVLDRLKRLEEETTKTTDLLIQLFPESTQDITVGIRYGAKYDVDVTGSFILDHPDNGVLGTSELGEGVAYSTEVLTTMVPGNNTFEEYVYDTEFYDSGSSSGVTVDTSGNTITFTNGGIYYSNVIAKGVTDYTYVTVNLESTYGAFTIELSFDGKSTWQTVNEGVRTLISGTYDSTGIYVRLTGSTNSTTFGASGLAFPISLQPDGAQLATTKNSAEEFVNPAIKIEFE